MHGSCFVESLKKYTIETLVNNNKAMLKDIESGTKHPGAFLLHLYAVLPLVTQ